MFRQSLGDKQKLAPLARVSEMLSVLAKVSMFISAQGSKSGVEFEIT